MYFFDNGTLIEVFHAEPEATEPEATELEATVTEAEGGKSGSEVNVQRAKGLQAYFSFEQGGKGSVLVGVIAGVMGLVILLTTAAVVYKFLKRGDGERQPLLAAPTI